MLELPSENDRSDGWVGPFRQAIVQRVEKHGVCYLYSEATPAFCVPRSETFAGVISKYCERHKVIILYKNGCKKHEIEESGVEYFMPEREEQRAIFRRQIEGVINHPQFSVLTPEQKEFIFLEVLHGRLPYKAWKETPECTAIKVPRDTKDKKTGEILVRRRTVDKMIPTKYFEQHWPDFSGSIADIRGVEVSLYDAVRDLVDKDFPDYLERLIEHLANFSSSRAA